MFKRHAPAKFLESARGKGNECVGDAVRIGMIFPLGGVAVEGDRGFRCAFDKLGVLSG